MTAGTMVLHRLDWDSDFFGLEIAEAAGLSDPLADFPLIRPRMRDASFKLCYASASKSDDELARRAPRWGGRRINSRVTFRKQLDTAAPGGAICEMLGTPGDLDRSDLNDLAIVAGEYSRFRVDRKFPSGGFYRLYERWMANSIAGQLADSIAVFRLDGRIRGMVTLQKKSETGVIGLIAVAEGHRGKSIGKSLMATSSHWFSSNGCTLAEVVTQGENIPAMKLYSNAGFQVVTHDDIYHFWND